jgi:hypothetical protein
MQRHASLLSIHARNHHARNLTRNYIIRNPKLHLSQINSIRQKPQKIMIDLEQIMTMLPRVLQTTSSDLWKHACTGESTPVAITMRSK